MFPQQVLRDLLPKKEKEEEEKDDNEDENEDGEVEEGTNMTMRPDVMKVTMNELASHDSL